MLLDRRTLEGIRDGRIDLVFRRWERARVKPGSALRTAVGVLRIDAVDAVAAREVTAADARRAGFATRAELLTWLAGRDGRIHRVALRREGDDPRVALRGRAELAASLLGELDRIDAGGRRGPWTRDVLQLIADRPETLAAELAETRGQERLAFKRDVRRLKELGLTESLLRGYRLSPRGETALAALALRGLYRAFNARDAGAVVASMTDDVDWPNAWEGGRVHGVAGVRDYWTRQWAEIDPSVEPTGFARRADGRIAVAVHQVVREPDGSLLAEGDVVHVYAFAGDRIARMDVEG